MSYLRKIEAHPNVPKYAVPTPKYTDKTANGLTRCIIDFLKYSGCQAERISNTGRVLKQPHGIKWIPGTGTKGSADISATIKGRSVKIEVKIGRDRQSDAQKEYQAVVERAGGVYYIARSWDEFIGWYKQNFGV